MYEIHYDNGFLWIKLILLELVWYCALWILLVTHFGQDLLTSQHWDHNTLTWLLLVMYLANCTRLDISFVVNLLARYSHDPTRRHWIGIKQIFRYLRGTQDMGLFFTNDSMHSQLTGYSDAGFLSDPHVGRWQTWYVFLVGGTTISWRSTKQTLAATSSNHVEILALHEARTWRIFLPKVYLHQNIG